MIIRLGDAEQRLENAKKLGETSLMFLVDPTLTEDNLKYILSSIKSIIQQIG
ncbi:hypothetical protein HPS12939_0681 [Glaesserella parasuis 12939]|nr:hypothetical protein HPS12939_0681 [Glaesserella parasuis 12939]